MDFNTNLFCRSTRSWPTHQLSSIQTVIKNSKATQKQHDMIALHALYVTRTVGKPLKTSKLPRAPLWGAVCKKNDLAFFL